MRNNAHGGAVAKLGSRHCSLVYKLAMEWEPHAPEEHASVPVRRGGSVHDDMTARNHLGGIPRRARMLAAIGSRKNRSKTFVLTCRS